MVPDGSVVEPEFHNPTFLGCVISTDYTSREECHKICANNKRVLPVITTSKA